MNRLLATASGLFAGGFLFHQFGYDNHALLHGWQWYLGTAPTLVFRYEVVHLHPAESMWPVLLPLVLLPNLPALLIGASLSKLLTRIQLARAV